MSEEGESKPHEPSRKKLEDARKKGDVPKSDDLIGSGVYLSFLVLCLIAGGETFSTFAGQLANFLSAPGLMSGDAVERAGMAAFEASRTLVLPVFIMPIVFVFAAVVGQGALSFAPHRIKPKLSNLDPLQTAKKKFGRSGLFEFAKSVAKLVLSSVLAGLVFVFLIDGYLFTMMPSPAFVLMAIFVLFEVFLIAVVFLTGAIGLADIAFQKAEHGRKNRMSRHELQQEQKDSEGDPHMKGARRRRASEISSGRTIAKVSEATVVVTNPTHVAVALKWERGSKKAPVCIAKGVDHAAASIRRVASEHDVPLHSDPPTARAMHATVAIDEEIRPEHFAAVAVAIRFAEEMRQKARSRP